MRLMSRSTRLLLGTFTASLASLIACGSDSDTAEPSATSSGAGGSVTSTTSSTGGTGESTSASGGNASSSVGSGGSSGSGGSGKGLGDACGEGAECASGFCADSVCCDTACDGACAACSTPAGAMADGTCLDGAVKNAQDLGTCDDTTGGCGGMCSCDAQGMCGEKPLTVSGLAAGGNHSCARFSDGTVKCWGMNSSGQLGLGDMIRRGDKPAQMGDNLPFVDLGPGKAVKALDAGDSHSCAMFTDGALKCWGGNASGQLGMGDTAARGNDAGEMGEFLPPVNLGKGRTALAVGLGGAHTCALLDDATVKCWGENASGQLGLGNNVDRGDNPAEMGDNLPAVDLGAGKKVTAIAVGGDHNCALFDDGSVKCWGDNSFGQLGLGNTQRRGDNSNEMGDNLPAVDLGVGKLAVAISAGETRSCALLDDATFKCWGSGPSGQLGQGDSQNRGDNNNEMGDNLMPINLGTNLKALELFGGDAHLCATLDDGSVKCWGRNLSGQLGLGDTQGRGNGPNEMGDNLPALDVGQGLKALSFALGRDHTCALLDDGSVKCWGAGAEGQLGSGDPLTRGDQANEMGDNLPAVKLLGM